MTIVEQAKLILAPLEAWAQESGGQVMLARDMNHLWEVAYMDSTVPRAILVYDGERMRGDFATAAALCRVDRNWQLAIMRGRKLSAVRQDDFLESVGNAEPFYDLLEQARDVIRRTTGLSAEYPVDYKEIRSMSLADDYLNGYMIEFSTAVDLARPEDIPQFEG